ncbi:MAG: hypothetical protein ACI8Y3_001846 [Paraglaciecola sp.]
MVIKTENITVYINYLTLVFNLCPNCSKLLRLFYNFALKPQTNFMFVIEAASIEEAVKLLFRNVKVINN